jgi:glycosyltransferase involved in cell wall biosynthesis
VDIERFNPDCEGLAQKARDIRSHMGADEGDMIFLYVGRLNKDKGIRELLLGFQKLVGRAWLIIVGDLDRSAPIADEDVRTIAENTNINWLGHQDDVRPAMRSADLLVLPSYREGFPNVVLQAGAMELPCIVTDVNGSREIICDESTGWIVPVRDADRLAESMQSAMDGGRARLHDMGTKAREIVAERFEVNEYRVKLRDFYYSALLGDQRCQTKFLRPVPD